MLGPYPFRSDWINVSQSPEYQLAYDRIAQVARPYATGMAVDIACGTGDVLYRLSDTDAKLVGTDMDLGMLTYAMDRLYRLAPTSIIRGDIPADFNSKITLLEDNILQTRLPRSRFDLAILAFEDLHPYYLTQQDLNRYRTQLHTALRSLIHQWGKIILVKYAHEDEIDALSTFLKYVYPGFRLKEVQFFHDPAVFSQVPHEDSEDGGYIISVIDRKHKHHRR
jgi:hypothetical protein